MVVGLVVDPRLARRCATARRAATADRSPSALLWRRLPRRHGRRLRRRRRRLRAGQHGQPTCLPRRRDEVDPARHRRRHRPRDAARGDAPEDEGGHQRPRRRPDRRRRCTPCTRVCAHAGGPLAEGTVTAGRLSRVPVARQPLPARPTVALRARPGGLRPAVLRDPCRRGGRLRGPAHEPSVTNGATRHHRVVSSLTLPDPSMVVLIGAAGSGKSTLAAAHFAPDEILSSDAFREVIAGDARDQRATGAAFRALGRALERRLAARPARRRRRDQPQARRIGARCWSRPDGTPSRRSPSCSTCRRTSSWPATPAASAVVDPAVVARHLDRLRSRDARGAPRARGSRRSSSFEARPISRRSASSAPRTPLARPPRSAALGRPPGRAPDPDAHDGGHRQHDPDGVVAGDPLAQDDRREDDRHDRVERRQDRRDGQVAGLDRQQVAGVAGHVEDADRAGRPGTTARPAARASGSTRTTRHDRGRPATARMTVSELKTMPVAELRDGDPEQPDGRRRRRAPRAGRTGRRRSSGDARDEDDRDDGQAIPTRTSGCGQPSRTIPAIDRDDRREDAGDRRDDAHPADRQAAVQGGDADAAQDAGQRRTTSEVGAGRERLAADDGDDQRRGPSRRAATAARRRTPARVG